jgi:hypothetical protein
MSFRSNTDKLRMALELLHVRILPRSSALNKMSELYVQANVGLHNQSCSELTILQLLKVKLFVLDQSLACVTDFACYVTALI